MKRCKNDILEQLEQHDVICKDCGDILGWSVKGIATFYTATCATCGEDKICTEWRDYSPDEEKK